jgi:hypothetical protein
MSEYRPLSTFAELALLDSDECVAGYLQTKGSKEAKACYLQELQG